MKTLYIVRHAKSSWGDLTLPDFDRPLNERGKKDAPIMAQRLLKRKIQIDQFVSSPANRAFKTCKLFCQEFNSPLERIMLVDELYHAPKDTFYNVIERADNRLKSIALFSHNPGITDFVNSLADDVCIDNMPTCAVFAISSPIQHWADFKTAVKTVLFFDYPKSV